LKKDGEKVQVRGVSQEGGGSKELMGEREKMTILVKWATKMQFAHF